MENVELLELQRRKDALSAYVVHDLKSPASMVLLTAALQLESDDASPAARRAWQITQSAAEQIHRTALNLLDIARSQAGQMPFRPVPLDVCTLIEDVRDSLGPLADRRGQTIDLSLEVPVVMLVADPDLMRRVLQNLVDNALVHGPAGNPVRIEVRASTGGVMVAVCDQGAGIPAAMREHIFQPYARLGSDREPRQATHGLGLTFCRMAVEAMAEPSGSRTISPGEAASVSDCRRGRPSQGSCESAAEPAGPFEPEDREETAARSLESSG
jgi:signal transduction histidine kinase